MAAALEERAMADDILIGDTPKARRRRNRLKGLNARGRLWKHSTLADIDGVLAPGELRAMFVFTLVRNPWDRMVSFYTWARSQAFDHPAVRAAKQNAFPDFVVLPEGGEALGHWPARAYVTLADGHEHCNAFVRLERLGVDLPRVEEHLGFRLEVPMLNATVRDRNYRSYYDLATRAAVARISAEDIARFGYTY